MKILINGCNGKMGSLVCDLIKESDNMEVIAGFDTAMREFSEFTVYENIDNLVDAFSDGECEHPDVIIDFSSPECSMSVLESFASYYYIPMVIATTGFSDEQINKINELSSGIPIFMSSNMAYEVNVIKHALQVIAPLLSDCDIEILEIHHNRKKDAPSGTAKMLAAAINSSLENSKDIIYGREGKREPKEIGISALRGGDVVGTHEVHFFSKFGEIELIHRENSRAAFAEGAIKAAKFLVDECAACGLFNMDNLM